MLIRRAKGWEIPERQSTPESVFLNRRAFIAGSGALAASGLLGVKPALATSDQTNAGDPTTDMYPAVISRSIL